MDLIGRKKFQEIAGLTDEEFDLLIDNCYLVPYDVVDNDVFFFENEAEFAKNMKDQWIREAKDLAEWALENPELDEAQKKEIDDEWDSEILELDREITLADEYQDRLYGDTESLNDDIPEDTLQDIYAVLGLSMESDEDKNEVDFQQKKKKEKKQLKKHRQYVTPTSVEESLDPNKGTRIYMDGNDIQRQVHTNYVENPSHHPQNDSKGQPLSFHVKQVQQAPEVSQHKVDYDQECKMLRNLHEQLYREDQSRYQPKYEQTLQSTPYQSYMSRKENTEKNYQSDGHLIKTIDYSRKETFEQVQYQPHIDTSSERSQKDYSMQPANNSGKVQNTGRSSRNDVSYHGNKDNLYRGHESNYNPETRLNTYHLNETRQEFLSTASNPKYLHLDNNQRQNDYIESIYKYKSQHTSSSPSYLSSHFGTGHFNNENPISRREKTRTNYQESLNQREHLYQKSDRSVLQTGTKENNISHLQRTDRDGRNIGNSRQNDVSSKFEERSSNIRQHREAATIHYVNNQYKDRYTSRKEAYSPVSRRQSEHSLASNQNAKELRNGHTRNYEIDSTKHRRDSYRQEHLNQRSDRSAYSTTGYGKSNTLTDNRRTKFQTNNVPNIQKAYRSDPSIRIPRRSDFQNESIGQNHFYGQNRNIQPSGTSLESNVRQRITEQGPFIQKNSLRDESNALYTSSLRLNGQSVRVNFPKRYERLEDRILNTRSGKGVENIPSNFVTPQNRNKSQFRKSHKIKINGRIISVTYESKRPNRGEVPRIQVKNRQNSDHDVVNTKSIFIGARSPRLGIKKYVSSKNAILQIRRLQKYRNNNRLNLNVERRNRTLSRTDSRMNSGQNSIFDNRISPNSTANLKNGRHADKDSVQNKGTFLKFFKKFKHDSRIRLTLGRVIFNGQQIQETEAYQGYQTLQTFGGASIQAAFSETAAKRGAIYRIKKLQKAGFTGKKIVSLMKEKKILTKSLEKALEKGLSLHNVALVSGTIHQYFFNKLNIDIKGLNDKQLKDLMSILKNGDKELLNLYMKLNPINKSLGRKLRAENAKKGAKKRIRHQILHGVDAYDAACLLAKTFRSAQSVMYIMQRVSIFVGRQALNLSKVIAPTPLKNKIILKETKMKQRAIAQNNKKLERITKIDGIKTKVRNAPKKAAGKAFEKVFGKKYSDTIVGKITGAVGDFFDQIFSIFDRLQEAWKNLIKKALIYAGGLLLIILVIQVVVTAGSAITTTVQSLFETSNGKDLAEDDVMNSAGGKILTALTDKDEQWVKKDVYQGVSSPEEVAGKKVYGGTDPKTGKKIEITKFGSDNDDNSGINVNFYNGDAYSAITGKIPKELLQDDSSSSSSSSTSTQKAETTTKSSLKKASGKTTYEGDEVIFASKGSENDGISKTLVGKCMTTGYCAGCNTPPGTPITATGVKATPGVTVAVSKTSQAQWGLSYGSIIYVGGSYYVVEDCGPPAGRVDIYVSDSLVCAKTLEYSITAKNVPVYKITGGTADVKHPKKITIDGKTYTGVHINDNGKKKWLLFDGEIKTISGGDISSNIAEMPTSNAKAILSMGTVYFDQSGYNDDRLLKAYCLDLWEASHKLKRKLSEIYQCSGCREVKNYKCNDENIKNAKGPNGKSYGLLDGIDVKKDSHGDEGCEKYYCNEDKNSWQKYKYNVSGCEGTKNKRGSEKSAELTSAEISQYPKSLKDEDIKNGKGKINRKETVEVSAEEKAKATADPTYKAKCKIVETYTESKCPGHYGCPGKHSKKYCPGHVDLEVDACIVGIDENEAVQLFQIDPGDEKSKMEKYNEVSKSVGNGKLNWKHWTKDNRDMVHMFFDEDWKDLYGIDIDSLEQQISGVSADEVKGTLSSTDRKKILDQLPKNLSEKRRKIIETAIDVCGKIPYHFGDHANYPGYEKNHFGSHSFTDSKGRSKKGLDCSHFVDWVYWTAVGNNLGNGSTETLKNKGKSTSSLKPGDVMVRINSGINHTGIFIGYTKSGEMVYVHETGLPNNNVMISTGSYFSKSNSGVTWRNMDEYVK